MNAEKVFPSGAWRISDIINGEYITRQYMGYTKKEAMAEFRAETKTPRKNPGRSRGDRTTGTGNTRTTAVGQAHTLYSKGALFDSERLRRLESVDDKSNARGYEPLTAAEFKSLVDAGLAHDKGKRKGKLTTAGHSALLEDQMLQLRAFKEEDAAQNPRRSRGDNTITITNPSKIRAAMRKHEAKARVRKNPAHRPGLYEPIEYVRWKNTVTGATASIYGAVPWTSARDKANWITETVGWTVRNLKDGTVGIGRVPWKTYAEAEEWAAGPRTNPAKRKIRTAIESRKVRDSLGTLVQLKQGASWVTVARVESFEAGKSVARLAVRESGKQARVLHGR
jgi:hypothetical protein